MESLRCRPAIIESIDLASCEEVSGKTRHQVVRGADACIPVIISAREE
jgi:hypothetical protein